MRNLKFLFAALFSFFTLFIYANPAALFTDASTDIDSHEVMSSFPNNYLSVKEKSLIKHVQSSIYSADRGHSKINEKILNIEGFSSSKIRHLLNNLCNFHNVNYLEIGCWKGSTFISSLYQNKVSIASAIAIDNWSEFDGPYLEFQANCDEFISNVNYKFYSHNCFDLNPKKFIKDKINIYFYDGGHTHQDHANAFLFFNKVLADPFIAIVDDWSWTDVRSGTFEAFEKLGYQVLYEVSLPADFNLDTAKWWNGLYIAVIRKN